MPFRTIDLCAGIGGIRRGFELTGEFVNVASAEIDKYACETYEHLYGENPQNDLTSAEFKNYLQNLDYDVLLAGFPCQTFSRVGLQFGFYDDDKGTIFYHIAEIIFRTRPRAIFLENVENLVRHDKGNTFKTIIETLEEGLNYKVVGVQRDLLGNLTYNVKDFVRNSKYFGIPQNRPRTYIMAFDRRRYGYDNLLRLNRLLPDHNELHLYNNLNDLLEMHAEPEYYMASGYFETLIKHKQRQKKNGNGFGYFIVNSSEIDNPIAYTILATGGSGKERNLVYDPQEEYYGLLLPPKRTPINDKGIRVMTPREWGKLQGFINYAFMENGVDMFSFPETITKFQQYKQFGNSVTIPVIETMAEFMLECFNDLEHNN